MAIKANVGPATVSGGIGTGRGGDIAAVMIAGVIVYGAYKVIIEPAINTEKALGKVPGDVADFINGAGGGLLSSIDGAVAGIGTTLNNETTTLESWWRNMHI